MSASSPEFIPTRRSLLNRLKNLGDEASWRDFFSTYWKLIYSVARKAGLSDAEAQDVLQETVISVAKKIEGFTYDPAYGSFKGWLKRLTQWRVADYFRKKQYQVKGRRLPREEPLSTSIGEELPDSSVDFEKTWDEEWEKNMFQLALERVKPHVSPKHYQMFYYHVCKEFPAKQVAERLKAKISEVYLAKYKVLTLIKREIRIVEQKVS